MKTIYALACGLLLISVSASADDCEVKSTEDICADKRLWKECDMKKVCKKLLKKVAKTKVVDKIHEIEDEIESDVEELIENISGHGLEELSGLDLGEIVNTANDYVDLFYNQLENELTGLISQIEGMIAQGESEFDGEKFAMLQAKIGAVGGQAAAFLNQTEVAGNLVESVEGELGVNFGELLAMSQGLSVEQFSGVVNAKWSEAKAYLEQSKAMLQGFLTQHRELKKQYIAKAAEAAGGIAGQIEGLKAKADEYADGLAGNAVDYLGQLEGYIGQFF